MLRTLRIDKEDQEPITAFSTQLTGEKQTNYYSASVLISKIGTPGIKQQSVILPECILPLMMAGHNQVFQPGNFPNSCKYNIRLNYRARVWV